MRMNCKLQEVGDRLDLFVHSLREQSLSAREKYDRVEEHCIAVLDAQYADYQPYGSLQVFLENYLHCLSKELGLSEIVG